MDWLENFMVSTLEHFFSIFFILRIGNSLVFFNIFLAILMDRLLGCIPHEKTDHCQ
jgi:hypothetical protein